jgi:transcriptional regulator with XRE-family HTH domain
LLRLKFVRINLGLRQRDVAKKTGLPKPYIVNFESGRMNPRPAELQALAKVLGVPADRLLEHVPDPADGAEARADQSEAANV